MMRRLLVIFLGLAWFIGAASAQQVLIPGCTGNCSFGNVSVTGTTVPTNGLFLPAANTLGFATNSAQVAEFDSAGHLLIGTSVNHAGEPLQVNGTAFASNLTLVGNGLISFIGNAGIQSSADGEIDIERNGGAIFTRLSVPALNVLHFGAADANPPVAQTLGFQGATGTNIAGANATIAGSASTGTGVGGDIIFQVTKAGLTGSTQNSETEGFRIAADAALPKWPSSSAAAGTQTFTNSPCVGLTTERWVPIEITGQTGTWFVPACQ